VTGVHVNHLRYCRSWRDACLAFGLIDLTLLQPLWEKTSQFYMFFFAFAMYSYSVFFEKECGADRNVIFLITDYRELGSFSEVSNPQL